MKFNYIFLVLLLTACSLNSTQEAALNNAVINYVDAHNKGAVMEYVSIAHPKVVAYYNSLGEDEFKDKFELFSKVEGGDFIQDGTVWEIESQGKSIHAKYTFLSIGDINGLRSSELEIIAISEDNGLSWFFVDAPDYRNEKIFDNDFRLLEL